VAQPDELLTVGVVEMVEPVEVEDETTEAAPVGEQRNGRDGGGVLLLFDSGTTTQLCHFAVRRSAQGRGVGRRMLELARGLVPAGRPLWLFTAAGGSADRAAAGAGWDLDHTAADWILDLAT